LTLIAIFHRERKDGVVTIATIYAWAKERGWVPSVNAEELQKAPRIIAFTPYVWQDPATLPMRRWLYGKHYIRKFLSATMAAGGLGKSSLVLVEAIAMATKINYLASRFPARCASHIGAKTQQTK
jgi:AAA domain